MPSNEKSDAIIKPENRNCRVWRYMDLTKYLHILDSSSLFFCRGDKIGDKFEGSMPKKDIIGIRNRIKSMGKEPKLPNEIIEKMIVDDVKLRKNLRKDTFINCWHMNENESMSMWRLYGEQDKSIALQTTYEKLHKNLPESITTGMIEYIDYDKESIFTNKKYGAAPYFFKRIEFKDEQEIRCILNRTRLGVQNPDQEYAPNEVGSLVEINLEEILENVIISPDAPDWFINLIDNVTKKLGYKLNVVGSKLMEAPHF